jgi:NADH:ubiquinone oxidoreductase subunit K
MVLDFLINKLHIFGLISLPVNFIFLVGAWFFLLGLFGALFSFERIVIYFMCIELM